MSNKEPNSPTPYFKSTLGESASKKLFIISMNPDLPWRHSTRLTDKTSVNKPISYKCSLPIQAFNLINYPISKLVIVYKEIPENPMIYPDTSWKRYEGGINIIDLPTLKCLIGLFMPNQTF